MKGGLAGLPFPAWSLHVAPWASSCLAALGKLVLQDSSRPQVLRGSDKSRKIPWSLALEILVLLPSHLRIKQITKESSDSRDGDGTQKGGMDGSHPEDKLPATCPSTRYPSCSLQSLHAFISPTTFLLLSLPSARRHSLSDTLKSLSYTACQFF